MFEDYTMNEKCGVIPRHIYTILQFLDYSYNKNDRHYLVDINLTSEHLTTVCLCDDFCEENRLQYISLVRTFKLMFDV